MSTVSWITRITYFRIHMSHMHIPLQSFDLCLLIVWKVYPINPLPKWSDFIQLHQMMKSALDFNIFLQNAEDCLGNAGKREMALKRGRDSIWKFHVAGTSHCSLRTNILLKLMFAQKHMLIPNYYCYSNLAKLYLLLFTNSFVQLLHRWWLIEICPNIN